MFVYVFFYSLSSVIGALIGKQEGRNIEVMNSFELLSHTIDDRVHIDKEYYYTKEEQCKWFVCERSLILFCFCLFSFILTNMHDKNQGVPFLASPTLTCNLIKSIVV